MSNITFEPFKRNLELEYNIDVKILLHLIHKKNLSVFMNVFSEYVNDYNNSQDNYSANRLANLLRFNCSFRVDNQNPFSIEEIDYLNGLNKYIENVKSYFHGETIDVNIIEYIRKTIEDSLLKFHNIDLAWQDTIKEINKIRHATYYYKNKTDYLELYFHKYNYRFYVVKDISAIKHITDDKHVNLLIVLDDLSAILESIQKNHKIITIKYKTKYGYFSTIETYCCTDWFSEEIDKILYDKKMELLPDEKKIINEIKLQLDVIESLLPRIFRVLGRDNLDELTRLKRKIYDSKAIIYNLRSQNSEKICLILSDIGNVITRTIKSIKYKISIKESILFSLSEIKRNNTLYILSKGNRKDSSNVYGEENLTSIMASNLRCLYHGNNKISVHCEAMVGNGRSDIKVDMEGKEICLIESKLINEKSNVELETRKAIDQLFSRYSENNSVIGNSNIELYIILFTYDKDFRALIKNIKNAIFTYSERNSLEYKKINMTESGIDFCFIERRSDDLFLDKERCISIIICNMEVNHKKKSSMRISNKEYHVQNNAL